MGLKLRQWIGSALLAIPALLPVRPAAAHAVLIDSAPAPLAHVPAGQVTLTLRYNSRIDAGRSKLTLLHEDQSERLASDDGGKPDILHAVVTLPPGDYTVRWQVLAEDGHITRGDLPFTVDAAGRSPPAPVPGAAPAAH